MENNTNTMVAAWMPENDLTEITTRCAQLLKIPVEEVRVFQSTSVVQYYRENIFQIEKCIRQEGLTASHTICSSNGIRTETAGGSYPGNGLFLMQTMGKENIQFVVVHYPSVPDRMASINLFVVRQSCSFRFLLRSRRMKSKVALPTVVLDEELWQAVQDNTIGFLKLSREYRKYGIRPARGIILHGPPGNGKTIICRWLTAYCRQHGISIATITPADIHKNYKDGTLNWLVNCAQVLFFDDIDISFFSRKVDGGVACAFLNALDGITQQECCIRIFTTNEELDSMDDAFKRPGRVDRSFKLMPPNIGLRQKLVETWPKDLLAAIPARAIAEQTDGFSFAELEAVRTALVFNTFMHKDPWNLPRAMYDVQHRLNGFRDSASVGFNHALKEAVAAQSEPVVEEKSAEGVTINEAMIDVPPGAGEHLSDADRARMQRITQQWIEAEVKRNQKS